jgi:protoheme IX farnesyltransferase
LAIAWIYKKDYKKAGFKMITTGENIDLKLKFYIGIFSALVIMFSIMPSFIGMGGVFYIIGAFLIGFYFIKSSYKMMVNQNHKNAKKLLFATIIYYPVLLVIFVLDQLVKINI